MDNSSNANAGLTQSTITGETTTTNRMDDSRTPGTIPADPYDNFMQTFMEKQETYDMNGACVPGSKEAGANLAKIQDNIQERFDLETQDSFGYDQSGPKKY